MSHPVLIILLAALALSLIMMGAWTVQQRTGNSGWVDTIWTFGLGTVGLVLALLPVEGAVWPTSRQITAAALVAAWSGRLGLYIALRTRRIADDPRYRHLTEEWGAAAPRRMFNFLQEQALGSVPLAAAIFLAAQNPVAFPRLQDFAAIAVMAAAIAGEAIADEQLRRFRAEAANKSRVCDVGLWRYSRHPNYFFEWLGWFAYPLLAIDITGVYPCGVLALSGPAVIYWVLVYATGIPHIERHMLRSRGEAFRRYQTRTNAFFPGAPKRIG